MTRALGSVWAEQHGLTHIPSVHIRSYKDLHSAQKIMIVMPNNGLLAHRPFATMTHMMNVLHARENRGLTPYLTVKMILDAARDHEQSVSLVIGHLSAERVTQEQDVSAFSLTQSSGLEDGLVADMAIKNIARIQQELVNEIILKKYPTHVLETPTNTASTTRKTELLQETEIQPESQQVPSATSSSATIVMTPTQSNSGSFPIIEQGGLEYAHGTLDDGIAGISYFGVEDVAEAQRENRSPAF